MKTAPTTHVTAHHVYIHMHTRESTKHSLAIILPVALHRGKNTHPVAEQALMRTSVEVEVTIIPRTKVVFEIDYLNYHLQDDM